jgi:AcrR family transcriptional regulator
LAPDERRDSILDAALPLILAHGADMTTRQLADAAGVAEGTLFRVFEDKQAIIDAAVARYMDPAPTIAAIDAIDPQASLEDKLLRVVEIITARFAGVTGILTALGLREPPAALHPGAAASARARAATTALFEAHRNELRVEPETVLHLVRLLCFAAAFPAIAHGRETTAQEIVDLVMHGVATKEN